MDLYFTRPSLQIILHLLQIGAKIILSQTIYHGETHLLMQCVMTQELLLWTQAKALTIGPLDFFLYGI